MKILPATLIATLLLTAAAAADEPATQKRLSLDEVYNRGRVAFHTGDYATARDMFATVLKYSPGHRLSRHYLAQIRAAEEAKGGNPTIERLMESIVLDEFEVVEDTIGPTVQYLIRLTKKASGDAFKPNIILKGLSEEQLARPISFSLSRVPASYALKTVGEMIGVKFTYDEHAIVGTPRTLDAPTDTAKASAAKERSDR